MIQTPSPAKPAFRLKALALAFLTALACVASIRMLAPPAPLPAGAPAVEFSAVRASSRLKEIAREPHPLGVPAHDGVRDAIVRMWRELGFEPEIQRGLHVSSNRHFGARVENILVRLPGKSPARGRALMLATHYDSVVSSPGAADAGSGVVALLETARALRAGPPLNEDIVFLITDAEEDGLIGAEVFCGQHPWAKEVGLVLNFEARGTEGPGLMFQTSPGNRELIRVLASEPHPRGFSLSGAVYRRMPTDTDLSVFMRNGMQGLNFAFVGRPYDYHTPNDSLAHLDLASLQHQGSHALTLARRFGTDGVPPPAKGDAVYFSLLGDIFVRYSSRTGVVLAGAIAFLILAALAIGCARKNIRARGVLLGTAFVLGSLIFSAGLGYGFLAAAGASHGSWLPAGLFKHNAFYLLGLAFLALAATAWLHGRLRTRATGFEITFGATAVWAALAALAAFRFPEAGHLLSWPAFLSAATALFWASRPDRLGSRDAPPGFLGASAAAVLASFIAAPVVYLLFLAMFLDPSFAAILAALTALAATSISPAFEIMRRGLGRAFPALLAAFFIAFTALGALTTKYSRRLPRPTSLTYVADWDKGRASWVAWASDVIPWTETAAGGKLLPGHPLPAYSGRPDLYRFREAPWSALDPPDVRLIEDVTAAGKRTLRFRVISPRGGRGFIVGFEAEEIVAVSMEGRDFDPPPRKLAGDAIIFMNPGPEGFEAAVQVPAGTEVSVNVRESNPGLDALSGIALPSPPPEIQLRGAGTLISKTFRFPLPGPEISK